MMERPRILKTLSDAPVGPARGFLYATLALLAAFACLQLWWVTTAADGVAQGSRIVEIPPHQGLLDIARRLDEAGVVRSPLGFALLALVQGNARNLKAGEYEVPQGSNTFTVLSLLEGGKVLNHTVLLREGFTLAELAHVVEAEGLGRADDVVRVGRAYADWLAKGYFHADATAPKAPFSIMIPPPNVTGALHMGHALNGSIQDTLIRYARMRGGPAATRSRSFSTGCRQSASVHQVGPASIHGRTIASPAAGSAPGVWPSTTMSNPSSEPRRSWT
jgi:hypothetical protein